MTFGEVLRRWRERHGLMLCEVAAMMECGDDYIGRLEREQRRPSLTLLQRFVQVMDEESRVEALASLGLLGELDPLALEVQIAMTEFPWSPHMKDAFRTTVRTMMRARDIRDSARPLLDSPS